MNRNLWLVAAALVLLGTMTASAQKTEVKANVPFDFIVNGSTFPAGEYIFQSVDVSGKVFSIHAVNSKSQGMINSSDKQSSGPTQQTKLVFHRYGNQYFLAEVWQEGTDIGRTVPECLLEKQAATASRMKEVALTTARR
jgi:hypothetical protein